MHLAQPDASGENWSDFLLSEARFFSRGPPFSAQLSTDIHYLLQTSQTKPYFKGYRRNIFLKNILCVDVLG